MADQKTTTSTTTTKGTHDAKFASEMVAYLQTKHSLKATVQHASKGTNGERLELEAPNAKGVHEVLTKDGWDATFTGTKVTATKGNKPAPVAKPVDPKGKAAANATPKATPAPTPKPKPKEQMDKAKAAKAEAKPKPKPATAKDAPKAKAEDKPKGEHGKVRSKDLPWCDMKVTVFKALAKLDAKGKSNAKTSKELADAVGIRPVDVRHYCYHAAASGTVGIADNQAGPGYVFFLTAKGAKLDPVAEYKKQEADKAKAKEAKANKGKK